MLDLLNHVGLLEQGWRHGANEEGKKDKRNRLHPCLLPFAQLSDEDKDKDRNSIRNYPDFARAAGMKIVFVGSPTA